MPSHVSFHGPMGVSHSLAIPLSVKLIETIPASTKVWINFFDILASLLNSVFDVHGDITMDGVFQSLFHLGRFL